MNTEKLKQKLLTRIEITKAGCWEWQGSHATNGYGTMTFENRSIHVHRASWLAHNGLIPEKLCILHKCDKRDCINPDHLFLGTYQDNHNDMHMKGRSKYNHGAKLTQEQAREIRFLLGEGSMSQYIIASIYGVSRSAVLQIHLNKSYIE